MVNHKFIFNQRQDRCKGYPDDKVGEPEKPEKKEKQEGLTT
jgi:hypothetical protein